MKTFLEFICEKDYKFYGIEHSKNRIINAKAIILKHKNRNDRDSIIARQHEVIKAHTKHLEDNK